MSAHKQQSPYVVFFTKIPEPWVVTVIDNGIGVIKIHPGDVIDTTVHAKSSVTTNPDVFNQWIDEVAFTVNHADSILGVEESSRMISGYKFTVLSSITPTDGIGDVIRTAYFCGLESEDGGTKFLVTAFVTSLFENSFDDSDGVEELLDNMLVATLSM